MRRWRYFEDGGAPPPAGLTQCLRCDGTSQLAYVSDPAFAAASVGTFYCWVRVNDLLSSSGTAGIVTLANSSVGGTGFISLDIRRDAGLPSSTSTYIGVTDFKTGSGVKDGYAPDAISANAWILIGNDSNGALYKDGTVQSAIQYSGSALSSGWYNSAQGSNHDVAIGGRRVASANSNFVSADIGHNRHVNRVLTTDEWAELYVAGPTGDPSTLSFASDFSGGYNLNASLASIVSGEDLTAIGSPTYVRIYPIAQYTFDSGTVASITATHGDAMVQASGALQFSSLSGGTLTNSNATATYTVSWTGVTRISLLGFTLSTAPGFQRILGTDGTNFLLVHSDGSVRVTIGGVSTTLMPAGTVAMGVPVDLVLDLPSAMDIAYFGATPSTGSCWKGTLDELILE
jgi:hypothetical protein